VGPVAYTYERGSSLFEGENEQSHQGFRPPPIAAHAASISDQTTPEREVMQCRSRCSSARQVLNEHIGTTPITGLAKNSAASLASRNTILSAQSILCVGQESRWHPGRPTKKTEANLRLAFAAAALTFARYIAIEEQAGAEGRRRGAALFRAIAKSRPVGLKRI